MSILGQCMRQPRRTSSMLSIPSLLRVRPSWQRRLLPITGLLHRNHQDHPKCHYHRTSYGLRTKRLLPFRLYPNDLSQPGSLQLVLLAVSNGFFILLERARHWRECGDGEWRRRSGSYRPGAGISGASFGSEHLLEFEPAGLLWTTVGQLCNIHRQWRCCRHGTGWVRCAKSGGWNEEARRDMDGCMDSRAGILGDRPGFLRGGGVDRCARVSWVVLMDPTVRFFYLISSLSLGFDSVFGIFRTAM